VRVLVDAQLPPALARWLEQQGHVAEHVADIGLARSPDRDLWDYALRVGAAVVTKDEDFAAMLPIHDPAPAVVCGCRSATPAPAP
jgi:predicted nuclease of predicted toxin-antitoxin system